MASKTNELEVSPADRRDFDRVFLADRDGQRGVLVWEGVASGAGSASPQLQVARRELHVVCDDPLDEMTVARVRASLGLAGV
ncbi:hypothetical protein [Pelomonas sp. KK5]|uniref:hypothetical protein n=1 Tax=Pelomonas sp. KK5 TaxID=1855730 RepID=UPI00097C79B0|nr:hypothetical protein [Pelomonas sp. KK5]